MSDANNTTYREFSDNVNMTKSELQKWLSSDNAKSVGITKGGDKKNTSGGEKSKGYESGEKIVAILDKKKADLTDADYDHMQKVTAYIKRHSKQKPDKDVEDSRWRYSLMNWGHDPLK